MKTLSNTSIAAIFAVGLTLLVALMLKIPYFADLEMQTTDKMLLWRYQLHQKYSPLQPDPHLVVAAIDQRSLDDMGRWPLPRADHGIFLSLLAPEKPGAVGWDIMFTEQERVATPAPGPTGTPDAPQAAPNQNPTPPSATPASAVPAIQPDPTTPATPPALSTPAPANTNAAPTPTAPSTGSSTRAAITAPFYFGADNEPAGIAVAPPAPAPGGSAPDAPSSNPVPATAPPEISPPAAPPPTTPAPDPTKSTEMTAPGSGSPAPPSTSTDANADSPLTADDQQLVDGAALFPNMVTGAEQTKDEQPPLDPALILPTKSLPNVTGNVSKIFSTPYALLPFPALRKVSYFAFVNQEEGRNGGVHDRDPMVANVAGKFYPSFDLQVLMQYWGVGPDKVGVNLGRDITISRPDGTQVRIPIDDQGRILINYRNRLEDFQYESYNQMIKGLNDKANGDKSDNRDHLPPIKDNIVIIGVTASGIDSGPTPLDLGSPAPLVLTHLNALSNVLQQDYLRTISPWIWIPVYALFLFVTGNLMLRVGIAPMIPIGVAALLILTAAAFLLLYFGNYLMPVAMPEIGVLLLAGAVPTKRFFGEEREKLKVKKAMSSYLSEKVMNKILANPDGVKLGGVKQVITIMFCDIRGFTAYCDNRDPQEVLNVVNEYFEEMTQVVFKYEGTVDKYIGDCIMAFWNAPEDQPDHAQRAVCCAMEMRYALANFKVKRAGLDTELFECGIGIHTGEALVGNMGSTLKVNYTAMGSTVNLGARLEALTKKLNERILISQATFEQLTGDFPITDRGEAIVPGFANPIHVYGVGAEQDLGSAIAVGLKLAKKQDYTAEEVTKPIWAPAPLPEDADPNP